MQFGLVERLPVTALAQRRSNADGTVVMASLTHSVFVTMEVRCDLAVVDMLHQPVYNLAMRELDGLILFGEEPNRH